MIHTENKSLKKLIEDTIYNKPEKHYFMKECDNKENKYMNQIGGYTYGEDTSSLHKREKRNFKN